MILFALFLSIYLLSGPSKFFEPSNDTNYVEDPFLKSEQAINGSQEYIVVYRMTFEGLWSEERFPKSYPKFRPPAQWSMIFGQTHDKSHRIFKMGSNATAALQTFAEKGDARLLATSEQDDSVFDQFTTAPLKKGIGLVTQDIILHLNDSLVSLVSKIVPSPDWFIGVDSLDLFEGGMWIKNITIPLHPLDAGTDDGLTFTSPKWRLQATLPIGEHTSQEPSHRAASFYYPNKDTLPDIAQITFTKVAEIDLKEPMELSTTVMPFSEITTESIDSSTTDDINKTESVDNSTTDYINKTESVDNPTTYDIIRTDTNIISSPDPLPLLESTTPIIENIILKYRSKKAFFPKAFRPEIVFLSKIKQRKFYGQNTQSNLHTSFLSTNKNKTNDSKPSLFSW